MFIRCLMLVIIAVGAVFDVSGQEQLEKYGGGTASGFFRRGTTFALEAVSSTQSVCEGGQVKFSASAAGVAYASCQWYKVGKDEVVGYDTAYYLNPVSLQDTGTYYCEFTDLLGDVTVRSGNFKLEVRPLPVVTLPADTVICYGDTVRLQAAVEQDQCTFVWKGMDIVGDKTGAAVDVAPLQARQYVVEVTRQECKIMDTVEVSINDARVFLPGPYYFAEDIPASIVAVGAAGDTLPNYEIKWYVGNSPAISNLNPLTLLPNDGDVIRVEHTHGHCTFSAKAQAWLKLNASYSGTKGDGFAKSVLNFGIELKATPEVVCEGDSVVFTARSLGLGTHYTYEWWKVGQDMPMSDTAEFKISYARPWDSGRYYCKITDASGQQTEADTVTLRVKPMPLPSFVFPAQDSLFCYGDTLVLRGAASEEDCSFHWSGNDILGAADEDTLVIAPLKSQRYALKVEKEGCWFSDTVDIAVNDARVYLNGPYYFSEWIPQALYAVGTEGDTLSYYGVKWYMNDVLISRQMNPLTLTMNQDATIQVGYEEGRCAYTDSAHIFVKVGTSFGGGKGDGFARTGINFGISTEVVPNVVCEGDTTVFTAGTIGLEKYSYQWWKVGQSEPLCDSSVYTLIWTQLLDSGRYYCSISDKQGRVTVMDTISLRVKPRPRPLFVFPDRDSLFCYGDVITLRGAATLDSCTFLWGGPDIVSDTLTWDSVQVAPHQTERYALTVEREGCAQTDSITIRINDARVFLESPYFFSEGIPVEVTAYSVTGDPLPPYGLEWSVDGDKIAHTMNPLIIDMNHDARIRADYAEGRCAYSDEAQAFVKVGTSFAGGKDDGFARTGLNFGIWTRVTPEVVCEGESALLEAGTIGLDKYTYRWYKAGDPVVRSDTSVLLLDSLTVADGGRYYCVVEDEQKRGAQTDTVILTVKPRPVVTIEEPEAGITLCFGDTVVLHATSSLSDGSYLWTGDAIVGDANRDSVAVAPRSRQEYVFTADNDGCVGTDTVTVEVNDSRVFLPEFYYFSEGVATEVPALDTVGNLLPAEGLKWYEDETLVAVRMNPVRKTYDHNTVLWAENTSGVCKFRDQVQVFVKSRNTVLGGTGDGFVQTDTSSQRSRLLLFAGSEEYCVGDTASVKLTLIRGEAPWTTVIKRVSDRQEAYEVSMTYPLKVYGKDTVLRFPVYATETYFADTIPGDTMSARAKARVRIDMKEADHIEFRTGWPSAAGQCHDISLYDSLAPMLNGLPLPLDKVNFYVDGEVLPGGFWPREQLRAGVHTIYCEYTGPRACDILSDEIRFRVDTLPRATLEMPQWACGDTVALLKIAGEVQQVYTAEMTHHYYMQGGGVREGQRQLTIPGTMSGMYEIPLRQSLLAPQDSAVVFEVGKVTDSHGCSIEHALRDTLLWRVRPVLDLQVQYPGSSEWVTAPESEITFCGREQVGVKASLQQGQAPWQLIVNDVASAWINRADTTFQLDEEGEYRYRVGDSYCGENTLAEQKLKLVYRDTGFFRGRLWLEGAYHTAVRIMQSKISGLLRVSYGLAAWPSTIAPVIDRVEVELREAPSALSAARKDADCRIITRDTCLLLANGQLADYHSGDTLVGLRKAYRIGNEGYYMVVFHRNHLAVMSKEPVKMVNGPEKQHTASIDFTKAENIYTTEGTDKLKNLHMALIDGKYMLSVGDFNSNLLVSIFDENEIKALFTPGAAQEIPVTLNADYLLLDVNFDGKIRKEASANAESDWLLMKRGRGKYSEVEY